MKRVIIAAALVVVGAPPAHAQWLPAAETAGLTIVHRAQMAPVASPGLVDCTSEMIESVACISDRRARPGVDRLPLLHEDDGFDLRLPFIGLLIGAAAGVWYAERQDLSDVTLPPHLYSIPIGALAGFVTGILVEDLRSRFE